MKWSFLIKLNFLVLALLALLFLMKQLRSPELQKSVGAIIGGGTSLSNTVTTLDWCDTRVKALERPGKPVLYQEKLKWFLGTEEVQFVPVEKWFGRNCRVRIKRLPPNPLTKGASVLVVKFINGQMATLLKGEGDTYQWREEVFHSPEMTQALSDLDAFPRATTH